MQLYDNDGGYDIHFRERCVTPPCLPPPSPPPLPPPPSPPPLSPPSAPPVTVVHLTAYLSTDPVNPTLIGRGWSDAREVTLHSGHLGGKWVNNGCQDNQCYPARAQEAEVGRKTADSHVATAASARWLVCLGIGSKWSKVVEVEVTVAGGSVYAHVAAAGFFGRDANSVCGASSLSEANAANEAATCCEAGYGLALSGWERTPLSPPPSPPPPSLPPPVIFLGLDGNENAATHTQIANDSMYYNIEFGGNTVAAGDWVCWMRKDEQTDCTGCSSADRYPNNGGQVVALGDGTLQQDIVLDGLTDGAPAHPARGEETAGTFVLCLAQAAKVPADQSTISPPADNDFVHYPQVMIYTQHSPPSPPPYPPPPSPPPSLPPPPSPPPLPPRCNEGSAAAGCDVRVAVDDCIFFGGAGGELQLGRKCLAIDRPFNLALIAAKCYENQGQTHVASTECLDLNADGYGRYAARAVASP